MNKSQVTPRVDQLRQGQTIYSVENGPFGLVTVYGYQLLTRPMSMQKLAHKHQDKSEFPLEVMGHDHPGTLWLLVRNISQWFYKDGDPVGIIKGSNDAIDSNAKKGRLTSVNDLLKAGYYGGRSFLSRDRALKYMRLLIECGELVHKRQERDFYNRGMLFDNDDLIEGEFDQFFDNMENAGRVHVVDLDLHSIQYVDITGRETDSVSMEDQGEYDNVNNR